MNQEKLDPNSKRFNWTALAQYNEDVAKQTVKEGKKLRQEREDRMSQRHVSSQRHQAAMYAYGKKIKGAADKYSLADIIRGELGQ